MLTASEQKTLLKAFIDDQVGHFDTVAGLFAHQDAGRGVDATPIVERARHEQKMAAAYAALGARTVAAEIGTSEAAALSAEGFAAQEIEDIRNSVRLLRAHIPTFDSGGILGTTGSAGLIGPSNEHLRQVLGLMNIDVTDADIDHARRLWLQAMSVVMRDADRRYSGPKSAQAEAIYRDIAGAPSDASTGVTQHRNTPKERPLTTPVPLPPGPRPRPFKAPGGAPAEAPSPLVRITSLPDLVEALIAKNTKFPPRSKDGSQGKSVWNEKTARQVRGVGQLFAAVVGSENLQDLRPQNISAYRRTLDVLPKTLGQSSKMRKLTLDEIFEYADDLDDDAKGRDPVTINRHFSQLHAILRAAKAEGSQIPELTDLIKAQRVAEPQKESPTFVYDEVRVLAGRCVQEASPALYWVTLLCIYTGARRSETCWLRVADIDLEIGVIVLVPYEDRTLKTPGSKRRIPLHPELLRLGFLQYVRIIASTGSTLLFPDLREGREKTPLGDVFSKTFELMLRDALPEARASGKTLHSLRHYVNSAFLALKPPLPDATRYKIMGHKDGGKQNVNVDVYSHFDDETLRWAIAQLPSVTDGIQPRDWSHLI